MAKDIIISDRYLVERKIGEGGMAKVYLAFDRQTQQNVAVKILKNENVDEKKIRNFRREAETLSILNDENIVSIVDVGEDNDVYYIVNEFIEGMTLKEYISTCSPLEVDEVIDITIQILKGLKHAHNKGVVHKDIKSQNILLNTEKKVKITDLGIADIIDDDFTRTQSLMGTPQYVAPEILNRETLTVQSDIYSVGILLYELLTGKAPFTGEKAAIIMIKQMNHPLPSIIEQRGDVPQTLENIAIKASAKKLENRYLTVDQMLIDLILVKNGKTNEPKLILSNDLTDDKKLEQTIVFSTENTSIETQKISTKKKRSIRILILGIILAIFGYLLWDYFNPNTIAMPNVYGENIGSIKVGKYLENENILIVYKDSENIAENHIISTEPKYGEDIKKGDEVILNVSQGPKKHEINNYVGKDSKTVENSIKNLGYKSETKTIDSLEDRGTIIEQEPKAGELLEYEDPIVLKISSGFITVKTPNFIGLTEKDVEKWAEQNEIEIKTTEVCSDKFSENQIIKQKPVYNEKIKSGDTISIDVVGKSCDIKVENKKDSKSSKEESTKDNDSKKEKTDEKD